MVILLVKNWSQLIFVDTNKLKVNVNLEKKWHVFPGTFSVLTLSLMSLKTPQSWSNWHSWSHTTERLQNVVQPVYLHLWSLFQNCCKEVRGMLSPPKCPQMFVVEEGANSSFTYSVLIYKKALTTFIQTQSGYW